MRIKKVKTAGIGCGVISETYIPNLMNMFQIIDLIAVCDMFPAAAKKRAEEFGISQVLSVDEIEASQEIELVINLTSPDAHYEVNKRMLKAGKHVFSEKTLAATIEEATELTALAKENGCYLGAAPDTVLGAGLQTARKMLDAGMIGKPVSCVALANRNHTLNSELFSFVQRGAAGAFPYDVGVYYIAALLSLLGPVTAVSGEVTADRWHTRQIFYRNVDKTGWELPGVELMTGTLRFASGVLGSVHFNGMSINEEQPMILIYGTEGILKLGDPNRYDGGVTLIRPENDPCVLPFTHGFGGKPIEGCATTGMGCRGLGAAELAWAIREERQPRCSADFALHTLEVLQGLERSGQNGMLSYPGSNFRFDPLPSGYYDYTFHGALRADAEFSLKK